MKKLPIGIQTFSKFFKDDYVYIDKTKSIHNLLTTGGQYYFISRPRRFGKSLLVSTLKEIFSGNKKLFKNLWIYDKIDWEKHPVIHIDFSNMSYETPGKLRLSLAREMDRFASESNLALTQDADYKTKFGELIKLLSGENRVVILIDEYDKPIIDFVEKKDVALENRDILRNFYSILKGSDEYIRFAFLIGVSKFSRVSVFSGLNNLKDITMDDRFSTMMGYTQDELESYFSEEIGRLEATTGIGRNELMREIKDWYNGYSWDGKNFLYNPFSILNLFYTERFDNYWFSTGTPTFLIKFIKETKSNVTGFENIEVDNTLFDSYDIENIDILSLLFQTGYLTVKGIKPVGTRRKYTLSYPNEEVKESFLKYILAGFAESTTTVLGSRILGMVEHLLNHKIDEFFSVMKSIFASIPYNIFIEDRESYYHTVIYLILSLVGISIDSELQTNKGRIDAVIETETGIYIMEFKLGGPDEALDQVVEKKYYEKYQARKKPVILVGVGFDMESKNISTYKTKELKDIPKL